MPPTRFGHDVRSKDPRRPRQAKRVGDDPNGIIYDPKTKRVFSADRGSKRMTAIDAKTGKIAGTIEDLGGRTEHLASDDAGHVFLNMQDIGKLHKLDAQALKVMETWTAGSALRSAQQHGYGSRAQSHFHRLQERPARSRGRGNGKIVATNRSERA